jgi:hypothetical protein
LKTTKGRPPWSLESRDILEFNAPPATKAKRLLQGQINDLAEEIAGHIKEIAQKWGISL